MSIDHLLNQVHCADALEFMQNMPDGFVDLCLTDPKYGIGEGGKKNSTRGRLAKPTDYSGNEWDNERLSREHFMEILRVSKNQIIFGGNYYSDYLPASPCWIFWDKEINGDFADGELAWTSFPTAVRRFKWRWNGMLQQDMRNKEERCYPCQKPIKLGVWLLKNYAKPGQIVMDCYCGSGSFLVAAAQLGHPWIGIDNNPVAVELAQERICRETAQMNMFHGISRKKRTD